MHGAGKNLKSRRVFMGDSSLAQNDQQINSEMLLIIS